MKLKQIVESLTSVNELMSQKLPVKISFKLSQFANEINPSVENFNKIRAEKLEEHAEKLESKENGDVQYKFKDDEAAKKFNEEINGLLEEEVEVKVPDIKIDDLGDISIEPSKLISLDWLIK